MIKAKPQEIGIMSSRKPSKILSLDNHKWIILFLFTEEEFVAALIYVDDVIIVGNDVKKIESTESSLDKSFSIK